MSSQRQKILIIGATGSVGQHVVEVATEMGYAVRMFVRNASRHNANLKQIEVVVGDVTQEKTLKQATEDVDAVIFAHGTYGSMKSAEEVDYGAVRNTLAALGNRMVRIALMTTIGATDRKGAHDWKRRGEWLVRASGNPYTIVRPAWFDCNAPDEHQLLMLQGDKALMGSPKDGVIARRQLAEVLVRSLSSNAALYKTFELHAVKGTAQADFDPLFEKLEPDLRNSVHGRHDVLNMPVEQEPDVVKTDLKQTQNRALSRKNSGATPDGK
jgi:uncharacterized protein YbjT (DUF2867 family)